MSDKTSNDKTSNDKTSTPKQLPKAEPGVRMPSAFDALEKLVVRLEKAASIIESALTEGASK